MRKTGLRLETKIKNLSSIILKGIQFVCAQLRMFSQSLGTQLKPLLCICEPTARAK